MDLFKHHLETYPDRKERLLGIKRYSLYWHMMYRTDLWIHSRRVAWIVKELTPDVKALFPQFDAERAYLLALVHDDPEIITGDIQAGNKSKMSSEELAKIAETERQALSTIADTFSGALNRNLYYSLLVESFEKNTLESMIVDWADKYDAFGEALHEIYAGNKVWGINVVNEYGTIPLPTDYYIDYFIKFPTKFPLTAPLFENRFPLFSVPERPNVSQIITQGTPHVESSETTITGYYPYDFWIKTTQKFGTSEDIARLYTRKE